jgi:hypothetical protein
MLVFSRGQKVLRFKFSSRFCQLSLNMLGRQQRLIFLVEKDQQVLQMGKTITKRNICIYMHWEGLSFALLCPKLNTDWLRRVWTSDSEGLKRFSLFFLSIAKRNNCIQMHWEVALDLSELFRWTIFVVLLGPFSLLHCLLFFETFCPQEKN